jgi:hypothetical protein
VVTGDRIDALPVYLQTCGIWGSGGYLSTEDHDGLCLNKRLMRVGHKVFKINFLISKICQFFNHIYGFSEQSV